MRLAEYELHDKTDRRTGADVRAGAAAPAAENYLENR